MVVLKHISVAAATAAALLLTTASPAGATAIGDVQQAMAKVAATAGAVGVIGGVYLDGKLAGRGTAGSRLLHGEGGPIPADARFRIGSQTKTMAATTLLKLVEEGRIGLDGKLATLLPEVAADGLVARADEITVRQLIQHTSGVPDWYSRPGSTEPAFDVFDFTTHYRPLDVVKMTRGLPRTGEPGEKFTYSNTGYTLIGMIIEKVTGRGLARELDRRLFQPLGMTQTYLATKPPEGIKGPHGHGYYPDATGTPRDVDRLNASFGAAAGGVISTTRDISAFYRAFQQGKLLPPELQEVITRGPQGRARPGAGQCGDDLRIFGGTAPGYSAVTLTSTDGRRQIAVGATRSLADDNTVISAMIEAAQAVLCPAG
ncbi:MULTISPECIES: serine hydrolase domain-containing protein [unclassified Crossiella]|uniref:serine hydrolase domain-containing protein n=1 Tax=unclassified Crossiella TaxID=2620835 RepID=UPI001FFEC6CC|nr:MULTISPECIES: serine hydrolase domain-containing protein [unclassified Crossiella]MCK2239163.1 beta-lactamase family protein [Crossiella sp. S99.2]MCK2251268.1 beta-lactamase family protein [Crossiella sp. S99.1]